MNLRATLVWFVLHSAAIAGLAFMTGWVARSTYEARSSDARAQASPCAPK